MVKDLDIKVLLNITKDYTLYTFWLNCELSINLFESLPCIHEVYCMYMYTVYCIFINKRFLQTS